MLNNLLIITIVFYHKKGNIQKASKSRKNISWESILIYIYRERENYMFTGMGDIGNEVAGWR